MDDLYILWIFVDSLFPFCPSSHSLHETILIPQIFWEMRNAWFEKNKWHTYLQHFKVTRHPFESVMFNTLHFSALTMQSDQQKYPQPIALSFNKVYHTGGYLFGFSIDNGLTRRLWSAIVTLLWVTAPRVVSGCRGRNSYVLVPILKIENMVGVIKNQTARDHTGSVESKGTGGANRPRPYIQKLSHLGMKSKANKTRFIEPSLTPDP